MIVTNGFDAYVLRFAGFAGAGRPAGSWLGETGDCVAAPRFVGLAEGKLSVGAEMRIS